MGNRTALPDPLLAPERRQLPRRNFVRLTKNELVDMPLRLKEKSGIPANEVVDFWQITYEALDAAWSDGNPLEITFGTRLVDKNGEPMDNTQRPHICAQAFAGLGIVAFPDSPNYTGEEIGESFVVEAVEFATGRPVPIPVERLGKDFVYDGDVRTIQTRDERAAAAPASVTALTPITIEVGADTPDGAAVAAALKGIEADDRMRILTELNALGPGRTLNGTSLLGLAARGQAVDALVEAGVITVTDGVVD